MTDSRASNCQRIVIVTSQKYGGIPKATAAKKLNAKVSDLITLVDAAKVLGIENVRNGNLLRQGRVKAFKCQEAQFKTGKWYTTVAECKAYQATKGKRHDGMTTVLVRMPYDEALAFATKNKNATLRYNRKK